MTSAIHQLSAAQLQADAVRAAIRQPRLPDIEMPRPARRPRLVLVWRLRAALA